MFAALLLSLAAALLPAAAQAQAYPGKPVKLLIPFPPAGGTDIIGRVVAQKLAERWGQSVVVENKPGAGGTIGSDLAAKSAPDGYTLLMATVSTHAIGPLLSKLPYDAQKDFAPITLVADSANLLVVSPKLGVNSVKELIAMARQKPGALTFASSGNGTNPHLTGELFKLLAGVDLLHIPYKGTALSIPDLANGSVSMLFDITVSAVPPIKAGNVKPLAVTSARRLALFPDLPTVAEAGVPGFESSAWFGLFAPAATPREIVARVHADVVAVLKDADLRQRFANAGADPVGNTPEQFAAVIRADTEKWAKVIKAGNVKAQ
jgi:tripartite-type tricarboxylate transporter receptor subunit TctC